MPPSMVHFNGSVNLRDAETVMREITLRIPAGLRRIPDGETGDRGNWVFFQLQKSGSRSGLCRLRRATTSWVTTARSRSLRLADGVQPR